MPGIYVVKTKSNYRTALKKVETVEKFIEYIQTLHEGATFLGQVKVQEFTDSVYYDTKYEDGLYILDDVASVQVYEVKTTVSEGYVYNSTLRTAKLVGEYELVEDRIGV